MVEKSKIALFGYGKTTKAIASLFGGEMNFFDDNTKEFRVDEKNNKIFPSKEFDSNSFELQIATPSMHPNSYLIKNANNLISEYDFFLGGY